MTTSDTDRELGWRIPGAASIAASLLAVASVLLDMPFLLTGVFVIASCGMAQFAIHGGPRSRRWRWAVRIALVAVVYATTAVIAVHQLAQL